jgi:alpha-D-ribose 1-methylphosphonate 5-triphosphate synthase subunit PhnG
MQQEFDKTARQEWIGLLARAPLPMLEAWAKGSVAGHTWLRPPETGLVMVRGRAGGTGEQFNLGEMTLTRCALRLDSGETGVAYVQGRSARKAELAALADGMLQSTVQAPAVQRDLLAPLKDVQARRTHAVQAATQATRVDFFTLVRGDT